jgi:hypothetical protein
MVALVIDHGWSQRQVAERVPSLRLPPCPEGCDDIGQGLAGPEDRSCRPRHSPRRLAEAHRTTERQQTAFTTRWEVHLEGPPAMKVCYRTPLATPGTHLRSGRWACTSRAIRQWAGINNLQMLELFRHDV